MDHLSYMHYILGVRDMREFSLQSATLPGIRLGADTVEDITCAYKILLPTPHTKEQWCGFGMIIPDPNFFLLGSALKNLDILTQKTGF